MVRKATLAAPPSLDVLCQATTAMVSSGTSAAACGAPLSLDYLVRLQHSPWALEFCLSTLTTHGAQLSFAPAYFCATTCAFQLRKGGNFSDEEFIAIRDRLSQLLVPAAAFDRRLLTPIASCLIYLMVRMAPTLWNPTSAIESICSAFGAEHRGILIEMLTLLPEEVGNKRLSVQKERRLAVTEALRASAPAVVEVLRGLLLADVDAGRVTVAAAGGRRPALQTAVLRCFRSWVEFGAVPLEGALACGLLTAAVSDIVAIGEQEAMEATLAVIAASGGGPTPSSPATPAAAESALALLRSLAPLSATTAGDAEQRRCALLVLTSAVEVHLPLLLGRRRDVPPNARAEETCASVWKLLADATHALRSSSDFDILPSFWSSVAASVGKTVVAAAAAAPIELQVRAFLPSIAMLLLQSCAHPDGLAGEERQRRRQMVQSAVRSITAVVGSAAVLSALVVPSDVEGAAALPWQRSELLLFALRCCAKHVDPRNDAIGALLSRACAAPLHSLTRRAAIDAFVPLAKWLHAHPASLCFALQLLISSIVLDVPREMIEFLDTHYCLGTHAGGAMQDPRVMDASAASVAFRKLCFQSARALATATPPLLPSLTTAIAPATAEGRVALHVQLPLFAGIAAIASHSTNPGAVLVPTVEPMLSLLARAAAAIARGEGDPTAAALALMRVASTLSAVLGAWQDGESGAQWLARGWPTLSEALRAVISLPLEASVPLLRALCPAVGAAIAAAGPWTSSESLGEWCRAVQFCWSSVPSASCLPKACASLCACLVVDERRPRGVAESRARARGVASFLLEMHRAFAVELQRGGQLAVRDAANELCDCVHELFTMTRKIAVAMGAHRGEAIDVAVLRAVLHNALRCSASQTREASIAMLKCFTFFVADAACAGTMKEVLSVDGAHVAHELLEGMAGAAPPWVVTEIAHLLFNILKLIGATDFVTIVRGGFALCSAKGDASYLGGREKGREVFLTLIVAKKASLNPTHFKRLCKNLCGGKKSAGKKMKQKQKKKKK